MDVVLLLREILLFVYFREVDASASGALRKVFLARNWHVLMHGNTVSGQMLYCHPHSPIMGSSSSLEY